MIKYERPRSKPYVERYERLRDVCKRIVDDPHSIDGDTKAALKRATLKYASTLHDDPTQALEVLYRDQNEIGRLLRKAVEVIADHDGDHDAGDRDDAGGGGASDHHPSKVADLLVETGKYPHRAAALDHVLHSASGQALLARMRKAADQPAKDPPMDTVYSIMKDAGIAATCAQIVAKGSTSLSELELVEAATAVAAERHPNVSPAQAFDRIFSGQNEEGQALRKAVAIAKAMPFMPTMVGGPEAMFDANDNTEQSEAYAQLVSMAEKMRAASPELSAAQAFDRVFTDKRNASLAVKAHVRPSATTFYPHPSR